MLKIGIDSIQPSMVSMVLPEISGSADLRKLEEELKRLTDRVEGWMRARGIPFVPAGS